MPRYIVERTFSDGFEIPTARRDTDICRRLVRRNAEFGVNWVHSYVSYDKRTTFCVYDAPTPDAIRASALANNLPVDRITDVRVLDPYSYS